MEGKKYGVGIVNPAETSEIVNLSRHCSLSTGCVPNVMLSTLQAVFLVNSHAILSRHLFFICLLLFLEMRSLKPREVRGVLEIGEAKLYTQELDPRVCILYIRL